MFVLGSVPAGAASYYPDAQATIVPANVSQGQTIGTVTLTQAHIIVPNSLGQAQTLGTVTLSVDDVLAITGISQAQLIGSVTLTQHHILSVNNLTQAQLIDVVTFGGDTVAELNGTVMMYSLLDGELVASNALDADVSAFAALLGTVETIH